MPRLHEQVEQFDLVFLTEMIGHQERHPHRTRHYALGQLDPPSAARALGHQQPIPLQNPQRRFHRVAPDPQFSRQTRAPGHPPAPVPAAQLRPQVFPHLLGGRQHTKLFHARRSLGNQDKWR